MSKRSIDGEINKSLQEEREGLLSGEPQPVDVLQIDSNRGIWRRLFRNKLMLYAGAVFSLALLALGLGRYYRTNASFSNGASQDNLDFYNTGGLKSNGTHLYNKTLIMVSIDGLRADYLDRGLTPHLFDISQRGLRAKFMQPIFPTITFPNHWTMLTGLYAESHGIVANNFWDPDISAEFVYSDPKQSWNASWWNGEPIWEVLENAGIKTANFMWIGPPTVERGISPSYFEPWRNHVPLSEKLGAVMHWIDMPLESRPQLILAYEPSLDQAGHSAGPNSALVNATLVKVDEFTRDLHIALAARNLSNIVNLIFVSDHGMADTAHIEWVYLEDFIGREGVDDIEHEDGWPSMGLRFSHQDKMAKYLTQLEAASRENSEKFDVYTHDTMPERYHFSRNKRIAPIYVVPKLGYALSRTRDVGNVFVKGNHGYDNDLPSMRAIFVADGPFVEHVKQRNNSFVATRASNPTFLMEGFRNVELKSLVGRLLGIRVTDSSHNGTAGFWDRYL